MKALVYSGQNLLFFTKETSNENIVSYIQGLIDSREWVKLLPLEIFEIHSCEAYMYSYPCGGETVLVINGDEDYKEFEIKEVELKTFVN